MLHSVKVVEDFATWISRQHFTHIRFLAYARLEAAHKIEDSTSAIGQSRLSEGF